MPNYEKVVDIQSDKVVRVKRWYAGVEYPNYIEVGYDPTDDLGKIESTILNYIKNTCPYETSTTSKPYVRFSKDLKTIGENETLIAECYISAYISYYCIAPNVSFAYKAMLPYGHEFLDNLPSDYKKFYKQKEEHGGKFVPTKGLEGSVYTGDIYVFFNKNLSEKDLKAELPYLHKHAGNSKTSVSIKNIVWGENDISKFYDSVPKSPSLKAFALLGAICGGGAVLASNLLSKHQSSTSLIFKEVSKQVLLGISIGAILSLGCGYLYKSSCNNTRQGAELI